MPDAPIGRAGHGDPADAGPSPPLSPPCASDGAPGTAGRRRGHRVTIDSSGSAAQSHQQAELGPGPLHQLVVAPRVGPVVAEAAERSAQKDLPLRRQVGPLLREVRARRHRPGVVARGVARSVAARGTRCRRAAPASASYGHPKRDEGDRGVRDVGQEPRRLVVVRREEGGRRPAAGRASTTASASLPATRSAFTDVRPTPSRRAPFARRASAHRGVHRPRPRRAPAPQPFDQGGHAPSMAQNEWGPVGRRGRDLGPQRAA